MAMRDALAADAAVPVWTLPEVRGAPAAFRNVVKAAAQHWFTGSLTFVLPSGKRVHIEGRAPGPDAELQVQDFRFVGRMLAAGDIGLAEGYMAGEWDTPDLTALLKAAALNLERLQMLVRGHPLVAAVHGLQHALNANTRKGARRNIIAHYDLGNDFYQLWLDPSMTYSSALFERPEKTLTEAQHDKYAALARRMQLEPGQSVLEIGCGWGGFAEFAAKEVGAKVVGLTLSPSQAEFARKRLFEAGLADRAEIRLTDYRDMTGQFDRIASIEMFEAVGEVYWPTYFQAVKRLLSPAGKAGLQIITIRDELFARYRKSTDFIKKYVFPGGMLPSMTRLREEAARAGLGWRGDESFGQDYARTLLLWRERFDAAWPQIAPLGFDERFRRLWRFYLSYCEAGFATGRTDVVQIALEA